MKTFLRYINPVLAIIVFGLCFIAATLEKGSFTVSGVVAGGFGSYFFAKGIFASTSMFLIGEILGRIIDAQDHAGIKASNRYNKAYSLYLVAVIVSLLLLLSALLSDNSFSNNSKSNIVPNPQIEIVKSYRIKESELLRIGGVIKNIAQTKWSYIYLTADFYSADKYIGTCKTKIDSLEQGVETKFIIECSAFKNRDVGDSITFNISASNGQPE